MRLSASAPLSSSKTSIRFSGSKRQTYGSRPGLLLFTVASLSSFLGFHQVAAYTASKSGVAGLTRALAVEWAPHGVTVNAIAPGVFITDLNRQIVNSERGQELLMRTPMRRFGELQELVGAAVFLASDAASFVTGQVIAVDGGFLASGVNQ